MQTGDGADVDAARAAGQRSRAVAGTAAGSGGGATTVMATAGVPARAPAPVRRGAARPAPERAPELRHLGLEPLREYRTELAAEEGRVSYWCRVLQARIDVVRAVTDGTPVVDHLGEALSGVSAVSRRAALLATAPDGDHLPALPDLPPLWLAQPRAGDTARNAQLLLELTEAERRLAEYRDAVARRIEAATADLIARYRETPAACLVALPGQAAPSRLS